MSPISNWPPLINALVHIVEHPEDYDQTVWKCGTTHCVAGWITQLAGWNWINNVHVMPPGHSDPDDSMGVGDAAFQILGVPVNDVEDSEWMELDYGLFGADRPWFAILDMVFRMALEDGIKFPGALVGELINVGVLDPVEHQTLLEGLRA
jgi:hypothetical protein